MTADVDWFGRWGVGFFLVPFLVLSVGCMGFLGGGDDGGDKGDSGITGRRGVVVYGERSRGAAALTGFSSCEDLAAHLRESLAEELRSLAMMHGQGPMYRTMVDFADEEASFDAAPMASDDARSASASGAELADGDGGVSGASAPPREAGVDFSGTNNQEAGVDEADFVKTDGYHLYALNGNRLEVFGVPEFGELVWTSAIEIEGTPSQLLLGEDRAVVFSSVYLWNMDASDPENELAAVFSRLAREDERGGGVKVMVGGSGGAEEFADGAASSSGFAESDPKPDSRDDNEQSEPREYRQWRGNALTKVSVIDLTDRSTPSLAAEYLLEGDYQTARRVGSTVRLVSSSYMNIEGRLGLDTYPELPQSYWHLNPRSRQAKGMFEAAVERLVAENNSRIAELDLDDFLPRVALRLADGELQQTLARGEQCDNFAVAGDSLARGVTSILTFDLADAVSDIEADHLVTNPGVVYASANTLVIAEMAQDWWWYWQTDELDEATNLHRFASGDDGTTVYSGSGRVPGTIEDQFSLSVYDDVLRVASTTGQWGRWWMDAPREPENHIYTLRGDDRPEVVGHVGGIAIGERIWSTRFVGDKAYMVTFRNIDPLWTIDMSDPTAPTVEGELEVPGVSTYIHPVSDDHLLTIGIPGDERGLDWQRIQVSLFDVSDFQSPLLSDTYEPGIELGERDDDLVVEWSNSQSDAVHEHKAFQYWHPRSLLAIPVSAYVTLRRVRDYNEDDSQSGGDPGEPVPATEPMPAPEPDEPMPEDDSAAVEVASSPAYDCDYYDDCGYREYFYEQRSGLELITVDLDSGFSQAGVIDHSEFFSDPERRYRYYYRPQVRRGIFMGDFIYAISGGGITANNLDTLEETASYRFVEVEPGNGGGGGVIEPMRID